jgi:hypothetical protein
VHALGAEGDRNGTRRTRRDDVAGRLPTLVAIFVDGRIAADEHVVILMPPRRSGHRQAPRAERLIPARVERRGRRALDGVVRGVEIRGPEVPHPKREIGSYEAARGRRPQRDAPLTDPIVGPVAMPVRLVEVRRGRDGERVACDAARRAAADGLKTLRTLYRQDENP